jgi:hypothetical protein
MTIYHIKGHICGVVPNPNPIPNSLGIPIHNSKPKIYGVLVYLGLLPGKPAVRSGERPAAGLDVRPATWSVRAEALAVARWTLNF